MIVFNRDDKYINLAYSSEYGDEDWVTKALKESDHIRLKKTFHFRGKDYVPHEEKDEDDDDGIFDPQVFQFRFAELKSDYLKVILGIITRHVDVLFHESVDLDISYFVADINTPIFRLLEDLVSEPIYVGGEFATAIPIEAFEQIIEGFPTPYEKKMYAEARMSAILKNYLDTTRDSETKFQRYMNKKISRSGNDLQKIFKDDELIKYETILEKIEGMLEDEQDYSEKAWQLEILQIVQLLHPKYIAVLSNVPIRDKTINDRVLDFLLVDVNGHIDIIEIKKPFDNSIITKGKHRNNYIPLRELSGTIMQLEKYIFFLNRWGAEGEKYLSEKHKEKLPAGIEIKITNPSGIIIMGRDNKLSSEQKLDFEVVKRKYKNVVDIMTYDNLIHRLKTSIEQIQKI
ncbi:MAG TPA: Shedu immune nuclease family protein [Bacteroidia bacterium]|jgi:hypothetical protein|nr:Shedu immune nuclease family protein [Bacteroidia bacterium]